MSQNSAQRISLQIAAFQTTRNECATRFGNVTYLSLQGLGPLRERNEHRDSLSTEQFPTSLTEQRVLKYAIWNSVQLYTHSKEDTRRNEITVIIARSCG